jgi:tetratricopeptide (TPR) repeat protein
MKKRFALITLLAFFATLFTVAASAQTASVKGICKDEQGKPIANATVEFANQENGRKLTVKTNNKGEYFTMGLTGGKYKVSLIGADGQVIWFVNNAPIALGDENVVNFDLAKEKAEAAKASGVTDEQRKQYEAAVKEQGKIKNINALLTQAGDARKAGNFDQAITLMEQAAEADQKKHDIVYAQLADSYMGAKKYPEAESAYKTAIELAPTKGEYHNNMAQAMLKQNKVDEAIAEYTKAAELDPTKAGMYYFNLGAVLTNRGMVDQANTAFDKSIAADPTKADAYYQKGVNLLGKATVDPKTGKMNAPEGTAECLNKYLELAPNGPNAQAAKDLLASLGSTVQTSFGESKKKSGKK